MQKHSHSYGTTHVGYLRYCDALVLGDAPHCCYDNWSQFLADPGVKLIEKPGSKCKGGRPMNTGVDPVDEGLGVYAELVQKAQEVMAQKPKDAQDLEDISKEINVATKSCMQQMVSTVNHVQASYKKLVAKKEKKERSIRRLRSKVQAKEDQMLRDSKLVGEVAT